MKLSALNVITSNFSVDELKRNLSLSYEPKDTLKFTEFEPNYKDWPSWMKSTLRSSNTNNPNTHYLGKFYQGHFELTSPRFFYWRHVQMYVQYDKAHSILCIELEYFKITMIPLAILWFVSILLSIFDPPSGLPMLIGTSLVLGLKVIKVRKTVSYFRKYAS